MRRHHRSRRLSLMGAGGVSTTVARGAVLAILGTAFTALPAERPAGGVARKDDRPNILIIVTDDQRFGGGSMHRMVMPSTRTWFRDRGTRYPSAFAPTPLCCPARASIFSGRYAHNHDVQANEGTDGPEGFDHDQTLQRALHDAGYRTGVFGKLFNGWDLETDPPHFDDWAVFNEGYRDVKFNVRGSVRTVSRYSTSYVAAQAARFVRESPEDQPWLLYVAPYAPHGPATPQRRYRNAPVPGWNGNPAVFEEDRSDKPPFIQESSVLFRRMVARRRNHLRTLMSVNDLVAGLMKTLRDRGMRGDTLAFFVSDNGLHWGEHGWPRKSVPYTASVQVPMFMRWPEGGIAQGGVDRRPVGLVDIAPTALAAAGVDPEHPMDGRNLLDGAWDRDRMLLEHWRNAAAPQVPTWASLRSGGYQYVEHYGEDGVTVTFREYYDLDRDPWQLLNLLEDDDPLTPSPAQVAALSVRLQLDRACAGTTGPLACP